MKKFILCAALAAILFGTVGEAQARRRVVKTVVKTGGNVTVVKSVIRGR